MARFFYSHFLRRAPLTPATFRARLGETVHDWVPIP